MLTTLRKRLDDFPALFWALAFVAGGISLIGLVDPEGFAHQVSTLNKLLYSRFGDFYLWFVLLTLGAYVAIGFSPLGKIRLGGRHAEPEHSFFSWFSMLFCAGMGTGFMFWGAAEPLYHFLHPPLDGVTNPTTREQMAFYVTFFHWCLSPWAVYGMSALAIAFFGFNLKKGLRFSSFLVSPNEGPRPGKARFLIDLFTLLAIAFGIAATLGMGVLIIEGGLQTLLGWRQSIVTEFAILALITGIFMISAYNGMDRGIKVLSNGSMLLTLAFLGAVVWIGPHVKMVDPLIKGFPAYLAHLPSLSLGLADFRSEAWIGEWTIKYWSWWIAWAPFVGIFVALISRGRTVRELVLATLIAPSIFSAIWFTVMGEAAINLQQTGGFTGQALSFEHVHLILYQMLEAYSNQPYLSWFSMILITLFVCDSLDSTVYTMANLCRYNVKGDEDPPFPLQLAWGILFAVLTLALLFAGGIVILQEVTIATVLPFTGLLTVVFAILVWRMLRYWRHESNVGDTGNIRKLTPRSSSDPENSPGQVAERP